MFKNELFKLDVEYLEKVNIDKLSETEINELYEKLNLFNSYIYQFVVDYYKYIYKSKNYGTDYNLSMVEAHIITDIADNPGITANILAKKWDKTPAFISQRLSKLEKENFIVRELNENDRKFYNLHITEKGKEFDIAHKKYDIQSIINTNKKLMKNFSMDELSKLRSILKLYSEIIQREE